MAAIQCARQGVSCVLVEPTSWLGGMLTSGGVSAFDGNHQLPSGLWGELRDSIYNRYGGPAMVSTGWVSNTLFEPSAGNAILQNMVHREKGITLLLQSEIKEADFDHGQWHARIQTPDGPVEINSSIFIDATELGDWAASMGVSYRLGMDSKYDTGEKFAPEIANDIIQDLTYVLTLKTTVRTQTGRYCLHQAMIRKCSVVVAPLPVRIRNPTSIVSRCWLMANYPATNT